MTGGADDGGCWPVVLADGHSLFQGALAAVLGQRSDLRVVARCTEADDVVGTAAARSARIVVIDAAFAGADPHRLCGSLKDLSPTPRVLVIDREPDDGRLVTFVEAGADGYLTRLDDVTELFAALDAVIGGHAHIPTEMLGGLLRSLIEQRREDDAVARRFESLTPREAQILAHMRRGATSDEMAEELFISSATVRTHVQNVLRKLEVHSQMEAAALARRHGLLDET